MFDGNLVDEVHTMPANPWISYVTRGLFDMMTSSNGNIFRVTGPLCGEFTGPGEFPAQRPVPRSFDVFFDLSLNNRLSKQPWGWWFETPAWSLWRHRNVTNRNYLNLHSHYNTDKQLLYRILWMKLHLSFGKKFTTERVNLISSSNIEAQVDVLVMVCFLCDALGVREVNETGQLREYWHTVCY